MCITIFSIQVTRVNKIDKIETSYACQNYDSYGAHDEDKCIHISAIKSPIRVQNTIICFNYMSVL